MSKILNVRLGPDDVTMVSELRKRGVELSSLVREAIRAKYLDTVAATPVDVTGVLARIYAEHPEQDATRPVSVLDRRAFRERVARRVRGA